MFCIPEPSCRSYPPVPRAGDFRKGLPLPILRVLGSPPACKRSRVQRLRLSPKPGPSTQGRARQAGVAGTRRSRRGSLWYLGLRHLERGSEKVSKSKFTQKVEIKKGPPTRILAREGRRLYGSQRRDGGGGYLCRHESVCPARGRGSLLACTAPLTAGRIALLTVRSQCAPQEAPSCVLVPRSTSGLGLASSTSRGDPEPWQGPNLLHEAQTKPGRVESRINTAD